MGEGVSDEQLDETGLRAIEGSDHMRMAGQFGHDPDGWFRGTVQDLVGEVRASHAREAELRAATDRAQATAQAAHLGQRILQQRIRRARAVCDTKWRWCFKRQVVDPELVRAALNGDVE